MITRKHFAALVGFAFVAAWIGFNFGYLGEVQERFAGAGRSHDRRGAG